MSVANEMAKLNKLTKKELVKICYSQKEAIKRHNRTMFQYKSQLTRYDNIISIEEEIDRLESKSKSISLLVESNVTLQERIRIKDLDNLEQRRQLDNLRSIESQLRSHFAELVSNYDILIIKKKTLETDNENAIGEVEILNNQVKYLKKSISNLTKAV